ncbi:TetR/AcrR family transcriptional regulator [Flavobacterium wongokense]|uniref:TetR/AcrR family transcriptional regulator n=1 Tax=Flavobacterium wongokense TaxID=2910674 RepID=UPI001F2D3442|nr:TetR/AcrR family transcriptional regulator [Flavobacterium sp. WG47]MCF6132529.1 TetR/AcrR family transcriptional regulator [Flavobacterium sp. WG47]
MSKVEESIEEQILVAAFNVFVEKGFDNAKMQDIADRAGIKRTVLNYYFRSKDLLYQNIAKTIMRQALPQMLRILNSDLPFEQKVADFASEYITVALKNPFLPLFIINELNSIGPAFIDKMLDGKRPDIDNFLKHVNEEMDKGNIIRMNPLHVPIHIISMCGFPIISKPMLMLVTGISEKEYKALMEDRKKEVVRMVMKGLKP